jgi:hypothetical protein
MIFRHSLSRAPREHHACPCRLTGAGYASSTPSLRQDPLLFRQPEHAHLAVVRLRSPQAARDWLAGITLQAAPASAEQQAPDGTKAVTKG